MLSSLAFFDSSRFPFQNVTWLFQVLIFGSGRNWGSFGLKGQCQLRLTLDWQIAWFNSFQLGIYNVLIYLRCTVAVNFCICLNLLFAFIMVQQIPSFNCFILSWEGQFGAWFRVCHEFSNSKSMFCLDVQPSMEWISRVIAYNGKIDFFERLEIFFNI